MKIRFAESGISLTIECGIQIPLKDTVQESEIQYLESGIRNPCYGLKNQQLSWIKLQGAK